MTWTTEELEEAKRMKADGSSAAAIAEHFGLTRNTVIGRLYRGGGRPPRKRKFLNRHRDQNLPERKYVAREVLAPMTIQEDAPLSSAAEPVLFVDRQHHQCGWVLGDPANCAGLIFVCGAPKVAGTPYCKDHVAASYSQRKGHE